jgi:hypothetical protein
MLLLPAAAAFAGVFATIVGTLVSYPPAQGLITYAHWINFRQPLNAQLTDLRAFRLQGARNVVVETTDSCTLKGWHVLPSSRILPVARKQLSSDSTAIFDEELQKASVVLVYLHGNAATRGVRNRLDLMTAMTSGLDSHVLAFE